MNAFARVGLHGQFQVMKSSPCHARCFRRLAVNPAALLELSLRALSPSSIGVTLIQLQASRVVVRRACLFLCRDGVREGLVNLSHSPSLCSLMPPQAQL